MHVCFSLIFTYLPFYFTCPSPSSSTPLSSCTLTCTPTSTTWTTWKTTCATPRRGALTLTTPSVPSQNLYGHPLAGILWDRQFENPFEERLGEGFQLRFLSVYVDDIKNGRKETKNTNPVWKVLNEEVDMGEPTSFFDHVYQGCTQRDCKTSEVILDIQMDLLNPVCQLEV